MHFEDGRKAPILQAVQILGSAFEHVVYLGPHNAQVLVRVTNTNPPPHSAQVVPEVHDIQPG